MLKKYRLLAFHLEYRQQLIVLRHREHVKSVSISSVSERTVLVYHYESVLALPTIAAQRAKIIVRHIGVHVIVVHMFQVSGILFKQDQQVRVVAYQMFGYSRVRLTKIKTVDVRVSTH